MPPNMRKFKAALAAGVKRTASAAAAGLGLYRLAGTVYGGAGVIFMLHRVVEPGGPVLAPGFAVGADILDSVLRTTRRLGWEIVSLDDMHRRLEQSDFSRLFACFTLDDGYLDNLQVALPVFRRHDAPFSVCLCAGFIQRSAFYWWGGLQELVLRNDRIDAERPGDPSPAVLQARTLPEKQQAYNLLDEMCHTFGPSIARRLFEKYRIDVDAVLDRDMMTLAQARQLAQDPLVTIGAHCISHEPLAQLSDGDVHNEIGGSKRIVEGWIGREVRHLAYPYGAPGTCGPREFASAAQAGFRTAVTTRRGNIFSQHRNFLYCLPRREIPMNSRALRNILYGVESVFQGQPRFQTA
jgi:peptidoglycan/xylan/chitin deacetylase (PgdA/CDA1 family)